MATRLGPRYPKTLPSGRGLETARVTITEGSLTTSPPAGSRGPSRQSAASHVTSLDARLADTGFGHCSVVRKDYSFLLILARPLRWSFR